jgi:hypothetical protein
MEEIEEVLDEFYYGQDSDPGALVEPEDGDTEVASEETEDGKVEQLLDLPDDAGLDIDTIQRTGKLNHHTGTASHAARLAMR